MLFLKYLDDLEKEKAMEAELVGKSYDFIISAPYRASQPAALDMLTPIENACLALMLSYMLNCLDFALVVHILDDKSGQHASSVGREIVDH